MRKTWVVARREYLAIVRTKAFLVSLILIPVMMLAGSVVAFVTKKLEDRGEKRFAVVDRTPGARVFPVLEEALKRRNKDDIRDPKTGERDAPAFALEPVAPSADTKEAIDEQRLALSERVRKGELAGFLEIGPEAMDQSSTFDSIRSALPKGKPKRAGANPKGAAKDRAGTRYQSKPTIAGSLEFYRWAAREVVLATRLGLPSQKPEVRKALLEQRVPVEMLGLSTRDPRTGEVAAEDASKTMATLGVGIGSMLVMLTIIMVVATPLMYEVLEEKMQRISEVLLGALRPFELMAGKLLGGAGVALTLTAFYLAAALWGLRQSGYGDLVSWGLIAWFLFYQTLALLMYGSMFVAVGAACSDSKELQTLVLPVLAPAMLPLFFLVPILKEPDGVVARVVSFFPPSTPLVMTARQALAANIQWWEPVLGAALVLGFTALCVWAAGRIFRVGILLQGKGARLGEMLSWAFRG